MMPDEAMQRCKTVRELVELLGRRIQTLEIENSAYLRNPTPSGRLIRRQEVRMPDDERQREPPDRSWLHLSKDQIRYWTDKLGVSKAQLEDVVHEVGSSADAVEAGLRRMALDSGAKT